VNDGHSRVSNRNPYPQSTQKQVLINSVLGGAGQFSPDLIKSKLKRGIQDEKGASNSISHS